MKISVCQIIGPAVAGSAGPVPTPVNKQHMTDWYMIEFNDYSSLTCRRLDLLLFKVMLGYGWVYTGADDDIARGEGGGAITGVARDITSTTQLNPPQYI